MAYTPTYITITAHDSHGNPNTLGLNSDDVFLGGRGGSNWNIYETKKAQINSVG